VTSRSKTIAFCYKWQSQWRFPYPPKKTHVRGAKDIKRENQRESKKFTTFCLKVLQVNKSGVKGGDLECSRCWCGIVVESTKAGWSEDSSGIPSGDSGIATPRRKVQSNWTPKSGSTSTSVSADRRRPRGSPRGTWTSGITRSKSRWNCEICFPFH
jgi:hypothetical protein